MNKLAKRGFIFFYFLVVVGIISFFLINTHSYLSSLKITGNVIVTNGLIAYYKFDGNANDNSGNGNNGVVNGANFVSGISGSALNFDGVNDYVDIPLTSNLKPTSEFTISAWVYPESAPTGTGRTVASIYKWNSDSSLLRGWNFGPQWGNDSNFRFEVYNSSGNGALTDIPTFFSDNLNKWVHIVGVFKGGQNAKLYLDNYSSGPVWGNINSISYPTGLPLRIGARSDGLNGLWDGLIDEVAIYNRALLASEIQQIYDEIKNPVCILNCTGKSCGDSDDCEGVCTVQTCNLNETCVNGLCIFENTTNSTCIPNCLDITCGDDGCNGSCGSCNIGEICSYGFCFAEISNQSQNNLTENGINCIDSDSNTEYTNGINYYEKGSIEFLGSASSIDYCFDKINLYEWYCEEDFPKKILHDCGSLCKNGICTNKTDIFKISIDKANMLAKEFIDKVELINLLRLDNKKIYSIKGKNKVKILSIIPAIMEIELRIDSDNGRIISTNKPWWNFLSSEFEE